MTVHSTKWIQIHSHLNKQQNLHSVKLVKSKSNIIRANHETGSNYPRKNTGDVVGDLNRRRGMMEGMEMKNNANVIKAKVPLSEMFGYVTDLRTITSGEQPLLWSFSHYAQAPNNITEQVVKKQNQKVKAD